MDAEIFPEAINILKNGIKTEITDPALAHSSLGPGTNNSKMGK
jgi:hypothetical protein